MLRRCALLVLLVPALATAQEPPEPKADWSGTAGVGALVLSGNTSSTTLNPLGSAQRETAGPAPGKVDTDTALSATLEVAL